MMKAWGAVCVPGMAAVVLAAGTWGMRRRAGGRAPGPGPRSLALWTCVLLAGALAMKVALVPRPCHQAFERYASARTLELVGVVVGTPETAPDGRWRATLRVDSANGDPAIRGVRVLVVVDGHGQAPGGLVSGTRVRVSGRLYPPRPPANPGEPDMTVILGSRGISGTLYVRSASDLRIQRLERPGAAAAMGTVFRDHMIAVTRATLPARQAAILSGMLFGGRPEEIGDMLQATGTAHLFAVSGLHVGLVASVMCGMVAGLGLRGGTALAPALVGVWLYATACGMRPSVVRAAAMLSVAGVAGFMRRPVSALGAMCLAGLLMVIQNPLMVFDPGAQMSFAVVFGVLHLSPRLRRTFRALPAVAAGPLSVSVAAQAGATPLAAWYFGQVSPVAIIANVPCVALAGMAVVTGLGAGLVGTCYLPAAYVLNAATSLVLYALEWVIALFARLPFAALAVARPPLWAVLGFYVVLVTTGAPRPLRRALGAIRRHLPVLAACAATAVVWVAAVGPRHLEVVFLSVGQGDSALIRSPSGRTVLVDGGGTSGPGRDPGAEVVVPYLARRGLRRLDIVVATHPHQDHVGGLLEVIRRVGVQAVLKPPVPEEVRPGLDRLLVDLARERGVRVVEVVRGGRVDLGDGVTMEILHPPAAGHGGTVTDLNDLSIVMRVSFQGVEVLFTGDAGPGVLAGLVQEGYNLDADVLKVPHHGARGSCPWDVLPAISPDWAVISVGPNTFGHPARGTLESLTESGARVLRTDHSGAVTVRGRGGQARVFSMHGTY